ncbi:hypothetical protein SAMD00019534_088840 [Acytostelium subglobosum LB1]|uniref:hypothetical protein n=1 Tax=Acytostelium subglobosum LB1 TaxID=1410327 RepID=UPI0006449C48|nr:hypothetical protein SAMD00019534_088840 [Acytostelium subglobosum LB1]GAM25709.1 hypothetical protein SAMD00019534_088840 [Acytostelium subglobosum LB1]|eukprot:XP_012751227.1 hypothetical protein SAMD00019534_088840 [Acytostelium subglobosum LB1]
MSQYKVTVRYQSGASPIFELTDSEGKAETIAIDKWKNENIEEFLKERELKN